LQTLFTPIKKRKVEHEFRIEVVDKLLDVLREDKTKALEIRESMPWLTEEEQDDLVSKVQETLDFLEEKVDE